MKKLVVFVLAALAAGSVAKADYSLSTDITFATKYVFRGIQLGDNTLHPSIEYKQDDMYAGYWGAMPIDKRSSQGYINEYDFYAGYSPKLSDKVSVDMGATYYYYTEINASFEGYFGITSDWQGFTPGIYAYYDTDLKVLTLQGSIGYSVPMKEIGTSLDFSATYGRVDPKDGPSYNYYGFGVNMPYKLNDKATFTVGLQYANNNLEFAKRNHFYGTVGLSIGF